MFGIFLNIIIGVVLSIGSTLLQQALAPKPKPESQVPQVRGFRGAVQAGGQVPQSFLIGTVGVPGKLEYRNTWGNSGETPNAYNVDVLSFGDLPISATAPTALWINTELVTVSATGHTTQGYPVAKYNDGADHLWWELYDGTQTAAPSYLTGTFGSDPDRPWLSDMVGRGMPLLTVTALVSDTLWTGFPTVMAQLQGIKLYDPRADTTAGGSGSQRWASPATWAFSNNNAVIIYNILRGIHDADGNHVWGGHCSAYQLPYATWAAAMAACDAAIPLAAGGTEPQFRAGREVFLNERPADVIQEFLIGANARIAQAAGQWFILVGAPGSADGSFSDADVLASESATKTAFPNLDEVINGATGSYMEPAQAWEFKETAPYYRSDLEAEDDDRRQLADIKLTTTFSGTQAQRVLKATVEEGRRFLKWAVALTPVFAAYRPLQVLAWTSAENQYTAKLFLIVAKTTDPWGNVFFGLQEIDPADHDWDETTDEAPLTFAPLTRVLPPAQPMAGFAVSPYTFVDASSAARRPGILLEYTGAMPDIAWVAFEVRLDGGADPIATGTIQYDRVDTSAAQPIGGQWTLPDTDYEVRAKFLPISSRTTDWSAWLDVTTPNVKLGAGDIDFDAIIADIALNLDWVSRGVRAAISNFERLGTTLAEQDLANYTDRNSLKRELRLKTDALEASFTEIIEVALGPGGAIATALSSLYAAMGGNSAEVNVRWQASAGPAGYAAQYAVEAAVDDAAFRSAAFGLDVPISPLDPTRFWVIADQFVVTNGSVTEVPFLISGGEVYMQLANIVQIKSGLLTSPDGTSMVIDLDAGTIQITT